MKGKKLFTLLFVFIVGFIYSQNQGDYRTRYTDNEPHLWSDGEAWEVYTGSQWEVAYSMPEYMSNVVIRDGSKYYIDDMFLAYVNNITIDGELCFSSYINFGSLTVYGNLIVNGIFASVVDGYYSAYNIICVYGDIIVNGVFDMYDHYSFYDPYYEYQFTYENYSEIYLYGEENSNISFNAGSYTDLEYLMVNKMSSTDTCRFLFNGGEFTVHDGTTQGFLFTYQSGEAIGTVVIGGNDTVVSELFTPFYMCYAIDENFVLVIDNPNFTIQTAQLREPTESFKNYGKVYVNNVKEWNIGSFLDNNDMVMYPNSVFMMNKGLLNIGGALYNYDSAGISNFEIGNATVNVGIYYGYNYNEGGIVRFLGNGRFAMNEGSKLIVSNKNYGNTDFYPDINVNTNNSVIDKGEVQFGSEYTVWYDDINWVVKDRLPSIKTYKGVNIKNNIHLIGDLSVNNVFVDSATYIKLYKDSMGYNINLLGDTFENKGNIYADMSGSKISFSGINKQVFINDNFNLAIDSIIINNNNGLNIIGNVYIRKGIALKDGKVYVNYDTLFFYENASYSRNNGYIIGNVAKKYTQGTAKSFIYPIGGDRGYSPVSIYFTYVSAEGFLNVDVKEDYHYSISDTNRLLKRYWILNNDNQLSFSYCSLTFNYIGSDFNSVFTEQSKESNMTLVRYNNNTFSFPTISDIDTAGSGGSIAINSLRTLNEFMLVDLLKPIANFTYDTVCNDSITFNDRTIYSPNNELSQWKWYFGDGNTSSMQNPKHKYNNYNTYNVKLVVTDLSNNKDSIIKEVIYGSIFGDAGSDKTILNGDTVMLVASGGEWYS